MKVKVKSESGFRLKLMLTLINFVKNRRPEKGDTS
jgi:hypothetical protein